MRILHVVTVNNDPVSGDFTEAIEENENPADENTKKADSNVEKDMDLVMENMKLKKENRFLKNRFDQVLEDRNEIEKDMEDMKRKYEEEQSKLREGFRKEKAEREHLRVRNTLLQDMSQIIVDKCMKPKPVNTTNEDDNNEETDPTEILRNKQQGYRRVSPADKPVKENATNRSKNQERISYQERNTKQDRNDRVRNTHESWLQCVIMMDNVQGKNVCLGTPCKKRIF